MRPVTVIILAWIMFLLVCCLVLVSRIEAKRRRRTDEKQAEMDRYKNMLQDIKRKISENTEREE